MLIVLDNAKNLIDCKMQMAWFLFVFKPMLVRECISSLMIVKIYHYSGIIKCFECMVAISSEFYGMINVKISNYK